MFERQGMAMVDRARTEQELIADWKAFMRLLVRTAHDHPSRPFLMEAVRAVEDRYWRRVRQRRATD